MGAERADLETLHPGQRRKEDNVARWGQRGVVGNHF